jgi:bacillolysin
VGTRSRAVIAAAGLLLSVLAFGTARAVGDHKESARWAETTAAAPAAKPAGTQVIGVAATRKAPGRSPVPSSDGTQELREAAAKSPAIRLDAQGVLRTITAQPGTALKPPLGLSAGAKPDAVAEAFASRYGPTFGLQTNQTLKRLDSETLPGGDQIVRFNQYAGGLPVLGGQVLVTVDQHGGVRAASGETAHTAPAATTAKVGSGAARSAAVKAAARELGLDESTSTAGPAALWLFDPSLVGADGGSGLRPTWRINVYAGPVTAGHGEAEVLVDAVDGSVTLVINGHREGLYRFVCDLGNRAVDLNNRAAYKCDEAAGGPAITRSEGGAASSLADVNQAYDQMGKAYNFYLSTFGRDSFDNAGAPIAATVRACDPRYVCPFPNAFWEGTQFVFGQGYAVADDVVTHEFTHAVTEHTSNLFYWQQSGAINEALSDIMGQFLDLRTTADDAGAVRWQLGEDLPGDPIRDMRDPTLYGQPDRYKSALWHLQNDDNGGVHYNSGVANKAAYLIADGGTFNGQTITGFGLTKSEQLWYRVMHQLSSGANYADLGVTLSSACRQLVGYRGFMVNDCAQVDKAVTATEMPLAQDPSDAHGVQAAFCGNPGQPTRDLFFDNFEQASRKWTTSSSFYWQRIPSASFPYSYAYSGSGSLNGWTSPGQTGNGTTAAMSAAVTIPSGTTYLWFAHSIAGNGGAGAAGLVQVDDGSGWKALATNATGIPPSSGRFPTLTKGYGSTRFDVSSYAGKAVKFRFVVDSPTNALLDWYIDDVRIYQCSNNPGLPRNLTGVRTAAGDQATLDWDAPLFAGAGIAEYEVTIIPAPTSGGNTFTTTDTAYTLSGLDPTSVYKVALRAKGADGSYGVAVTLALRLTPPPASCTEEAGPINPYTGRPMPACRPVSVTRPR